MRDVVFKSIAPAPSRSRHPEELPELAWACPDRGIAHAATISSLY